MIKLGFLKLFILAANGQIRLEILIYKFFEVSREITVVVYRNLKRSFIMQMKK